MRIDWGPPVKVGKQPPGGLPVLLLLHVTNDISRRIQGSELPR
jgi:hypothetical protein